MNKLTLFTPFIWTNWNMQSFDSQNMPTMYEKLEERTYNTSFIHIVIQKLKK